jgi:hypothetical protein
MSALQVNSGTLFLDLLFSHLPLDARRCIAPFCAVVLVYVGSVKNVTPPLQMPEQEKKKA